MDKQEVNYEKATILFEDKNGDAWCRRLTPTEARILLGTVACLDLEHQGEIDAIPVQPVKIYRREWRTENDEA
ncbi:hypothetical protein RO179_000777 [Escherichia coli]|nr:hypothetical protein [Escherichia coli]